VDFKTGDWIVEALKLIEASTHIKLMGYALTLAALLHAIAKLVAALR